MLTCSFVLHPHWQDLWRSTSISFSPTCSYLTSSKRLLNDFSNGASFERDQKSIRRKRFPNSVHWNDFQGSISGSYGTKIVSIDQGWSLANAGWTRHCYFGHFDPAHAWNYWISMLDPQGFMSFEEDQSWKSWSHWSQSDRGVQWLKTYLAPWNVVCITLSFFISISEGWHSNKSWLQQPPHRSIRIQVGKMNTLGSALPLSATVISSGLQRAGSAYGTSSSSSGPWWPSFSSWSGFLGRDLVSWLPNKREIGDKKYLNNGLAPTYLSMNQGQKSLIFEPFGF